MGRGRCQREANSALLWEGNSAHPWVHSEASAGRTRLALSISLRVASLDDLRAFHRRLVAGGFGSTLSSRQRHRLLLLGSEGNRTGSVGNFSTIRWRSPRP